VIIVGAGVAGLACALDLAAAGVPVRVLEGSDAVGGRMRTDQHRGFLLDRGFQVFNTSYPQVRRRLDLRALRLRPFTPGVLLQTGGRRLRFTDPTRQPAGAADLLRGRLGGPADVLALARLSASDMLLPARLIKHQPDRTTVAALAGHRNRQRAEAAAHGPGYRHSGYVFTCLNGDPMAPDRLTCTFKKMAALPPVRLHDQRHGAASLALSAGWS
jgi:phytoene dehydrogenase-like protein